MAIQVQLRRGTAAQNNAFTGAIGEVSFDITNNQLRVHDGSTAGGFKIGTGDFPTGTANVALGNTALDDLDGSSPGGNNVAVGHNALTANTTASNNVAVGSGALATSTTATDNTAVGFQALTANTSGADNVAVGDEAGHDISTGSRNTIIGSKAGDAATTTDDTTLVGYGAGGGAIMTGHDNTGIGSNALSATSSGSFNTAVGKDAGLAISTGANNVAVGFEALKTEDGNGNNVAIGFQALKVQNAGADAHNVAVGYQAGVALTTGIRNTLVGATAGDEIVGGERNTAVGYGALHTETEGDRSTAVGVFALSTQNISGGGNAYNTAVGYAAGNVLTTGTANTFIGGLAGDGTDDGVNNVAVGYNALSANAHDGNTAVGGGAASGATGTNNTAIGKDAGYGLTDGGNNTLLGVDSGFYLAGGNDNTIIGQYNGNEDGVDLRNANDNVVLSNGDGLVRAISSYQGYFKVKSINAVFSGVTGASHEMNHDNNDTPNFRLHQQHGSYVSSSFTNVCARAANSGYFFVDNYSGDGSDAESRMRGDGNNYADGSWNGGGADYAEYFEWKDGNSDSQDRTGYTVVLDNEKIRLATSDDAAANIIGAVSVNPSVVGDSDIDRWKQKYLRNDFGAYQKETYTITEWTETVKENTDAVLDDDGNVITPALPEKTREVRHSYETDKIPDDVTVPDNATVSTKDANENTLERRKLNPDYNPDTAYVSREDRKEWATIGLMGKLRIRKGQTTGDRWIKMRDVSDSVEEWLVR